MTIICIMDSRAILTVKDGKRGEGKDKEGEKKQGCDQGKRGRASLMLWSSQNEI